MKRGIIRSAVILLSIAAVSFLIGFITAKMKRTNVGERIDRDTITYVDTIAYYKPVAKDSAAVRYVTRVLRVAGHEVPPTSPVGHQTGGTAQGGSLPRTTVAYMKADGNDGVNGSNGLDGLNGCDEGDTFLAENYAQNIGENIPPQELASPKLLTLNHSCKHDGIRLTEVLSDERDSMAVEIPITQKRYDGDDYRAYVSGYEPNLDSIFVFPKTTVIHERSYKPPNKWHIGITGGYGYGFKSKQAEPYIGIGITYSIFSF